MVMTIGRRVRSANPSAMTAALPIRHLLLSPDKLEPPRADIIRIEISIET